MTITELAIKRPVLIIVLFTTLAILGIFGYSQMQYELIPKLDIPVVNVNTQYPGASAQEVESSVTKKIEDAISGLDKVDSVVATSQENVSSVTINFTQEANIDFALQDAQRKVNQIISTLPSGVKTPALSKVSLDDMPVLIFGVTSTLPDVQFYQLVNDHIKPRLSQLAGVGQVMIMGGKQRTIRVNLNHDKLNSYKLSAGQVLQAVQSGNLEYPTGSFKDSDRQFGVRLAGKFQSLEELRELVVGRSDGGLIHLTDVAEVRDGTKDTTVITRINGKTTLGIMVQKQSDANAVNVSKNVRAELAVIEKEYAEINLQANMAMDNSTFTVDSANAVKEDLLLAILLVAGVMLLFLHSYRNALIVMVAIPTSMVTTFIGMWLMGATLNVITLLALSLVVGILVDDAIVVLENIYRHMEMGKDKRTASLDGRNEIGFTALSITMVDVVVYLPLCLVSGTIGGILRAFSLVIVVSTLTSLFVSFTVTPMLSSRFGRLEQLTGRTWMGRFGLWFERVYEALTQDYLKVLRLCLKHPVIVLLVALAMFIGAISLVGGGFIGSEFMPQSDQGSLQITVEMPNGTKVEQTNQITQTMEQAMTRLPEVETVFVGTGISGQNSTSGNYAVFYVNLIPKEERHRSTEEVRADLKRQFAMIPGLTVHITIASSMSGGGSSAPIQLAVQGSNWSVVSQAAEQVKKIAEAIPGTSDVRLSSEEGKPEMKVVFDRQKMASLELDVATVGQTLQIGLTGNDDSKFLDTDGNEYPIQVMLDSSNRTRTDDIGALTVKNPSGKLVQLGQFTTIAPSSGPTKLERRDRNYAISVMSEAVGRASGDIGSDIMKAVGKAQLPPGVTVGFVGTLKSQQESFINLGIAMIAAIIFVYLIMAALYNSFIYPFSVLFSVPLAIIGALLALALTQNTLAIFSIMGMIMLVGLVSKNAILLVDFANRAREEEGMSVNDALIQAGRERLRPILMTTLTMIFGMLPLALSSAPGSEFKNGLGWALIGGLTVSMLMTLVVVPVVYTRVEKIRGLFLGIFGRKKVSLN